MINIAFAFLSLLAAAPAGSQGQHDILRVNGAKLAYEVAGQGPAIVLIHAGVADMSMWDEPFHALAKQFRVLRYDTRGYGESISQAVAFSNRADLLALMDHLKIDKAVIVGNSRGGQIAVDFALEHPSRVNALVFVAGGLSGFEKTPEGAKLKPTKHEKQVFDRIEALYGKKDIKRAAALEAATWASGPDQKPNRAPAALIERLRKMILHNNLVNTTEPKPIPLNPPAAARLAEMKMPVLVMIGDDDESATRVMADYLAAHAPHARKITYRNTAHLISLERPKEFLTEVVTFATAANKRTR